MPLPAANTEWPPPDTRKPAELYRIYGAWYSGDPQQLASAYREFVTTGSVADPTQRTRPAQYAGGLIGLAARMFWGAPPPSGSIAQAKFHLPLAADIASVSASLLFGEPPKVRTPEQAKAQDRLELMMGEGGAHAALIEGAELAAAYGGVFYRVVWDPEIAEYPLIDAIPPDAAIPEWRLGRLKSVTFWRDLGVEGGHTFRHLESHEKGRIVHALYQGGGSTIGRLVPLSEHPATEVFADLVDADSSIPTGSEQLTAQYMPNMRPNRVLRGSPIGRSDFQGIEGMMDALDETWSSLMRDLRLGKGRLIVPNSMLENLGPGQGARFDSEQEIFTGVDALASPTAQGLPITEVQFAIRVTEHLAIAEELARKALRAAGYSASTFGDQGETAMTATESVHRKEATALTRERKIEYARHPLALLFQAALDVDTHVFRPDGVEAQRPELEWPDATAVDPEAQARTLQMLRGAQLVSQRTGVIELHPDWDKAQVDEELEALAEEGSAGMPDDIPEPGDGAGEVPAFPIDEGPDGDPPGDAVAAAEEATRGAAPDPARRRPSPRPQPGVRVPAGSPVGRPPRA